MVGIDQHHRETRVSQAGGSGIVGKDRDNEQAVYPSLPGQFAQIRGALFVRLHIVQNELSSRLRNHHIGGPQDFAEKWPREVGDHHSNRASAFGGHTACNKIWTIVQCINRS